ncbi:terminase small subunit [Defluviitalea raffinosedens]|uniref:Terminase small subunit n=1 Tax=Defluviitalea raffinosedens TaxID=1450156 RepID=A0A7C8LE96_9FIRM|nr:terminase small subunit [Defluviitalea raffinosedens]KAE9633727.1 terminase small subunit [Defluviitalea raffinosedens]
MKLTPKQKLFVDEYLVDLNATRAYKEVYKNVKNDETAAVNGNRLLRNAKVKEYLEKRMKDREKRTEINQDKVLQELANIAFSNGSDFVKIVEKTFMDPVYDEEGNRTGEKPITYKTVEILSTADIPKNKLSAIAGIKQGANGIEIKLNDKVKALELLGRHLGMFNDKIDINGNMNVNNPFSGLTTEELKKLIKDD